MLMQCQNEMLKYGNLSSPYKGITDCFRRTIKHEGVLSLWRGNSVNVINVVTYEASISGLVHLVRHGYLGRVREPPLWMICLSGMLGVLCEYPLLYARTRLGNDVKAARNIQLSLDSSLKSFGSAAGDRKFNGVFDVFKKTFKSDGLIGFYRGYSSACVGFLAYPASGVIESHYRQKETKEIKHIKL
ncbi:ADP ATP carrier protein 2 mitochondrial [Bienertia sinuspersici]